MPKTKDAFAFREFYSAGNIESGNIETVTADDYLKAFSKGFYKPLKKNYKDIFLICNDRNIMSDDINNIFEVDTSKYVIRYLESLIEIVKNHLRRLGLLTSNLAVKLTENLSDETLKIKITRLKFLTNAYNVILDSMIEHLKTEDEILAIKRRMFKRFIQESFGRRLKNARKKSGFTGAVVAKYLGISQNSYSEYETGKSTPPLATIYILAKKFRVTADYLLCLDTGL